MVSILRIRGVQDGFEVRHEPAARELWAKIYEDLSEEGYGQAGAVTDRAEAQVLRLSLLYALADASETVGVPHLTAALALWCYCETSAYWLSPEETGGRTAERWFCTKRGHE